MAQMMCKQYVAYWQRIRKQQQCHTNHRLTYPKVYSHSGISSTQCVHQICSCIYLVFIPGGGGKLQCTDFEGRGANFQCTRITEFLCPWYQLIMTCPEHIKCHHHSILSPSISRAIRDSTGPGVSLFFRVLSGGGEVISFYVTSGVKVTFLSQSHSLFSRGNMQKSGLPSPPPPLPPLANLLMCMVQPQVAGLMLDDIAYYRVNYSILYRRRRKKMDALSQKVRDWPINYTIFTSLYTP